MPVTSPRFKMNGASIDQDSFLSQQIFESLNQKTSAGQIASFFKTYDSNIVITDIYDLFILAYGGNVNAYFESAVNIALKLPQPLSVGQTFNFIIACLGTTLSTVMASTASLVLNGSIDIPAGSARWFSGAINQLTTTSGAMFSKNTAFSSLSFYSTNILGLTTSGNSNGNIFYGQAVYLNVLAGTLPSGWYPIIAVGSLNYYLIGVPPSLYTFTCTNAVLGIGNPETPVFSPIITITGLMRTPTGSIIA